MAATQRAAKPRKEHRPPAGTPTPCGARGGTLVGKVVPGRGGGVVKSCAVPPRAHPRRTDVLVVPQGKLIVDGRPMPLSRARRRIRLRETLVSLTSLDAAYLYDAHQSFARTGIPAPTGVEFPHQAGSSRCDPQHPVWSGYEDAREAAAEEASSVTSELDEDAEGADEAYAEAMLAALKRHPRFAEWLRTSQECARGFADRQERRAVKHESAASQRAALKRKAAASRGDERDVLGGYLSEKLDELSERKWRPKATPKILRARAHPKAKR